MSGFGRQHQAVVNEAGAMDLLTPCVDSDHMQKGDLLAWTLGFRKDAPRDMGGPALIKEVRSGATGKETAFPQSQRGVAEREPIACGGRYLDG